MNERSNKKMRKSRFSIEEIMNILKEGETGEILISSLCRKYDISNVTYYQWRRKYNGFTIPEAKRIKVLEEENNRLKKLLAERDQKVSVLKEVIRKNF